MQRKVREWQASGVRLVLFVYLDTQMIAAHRTPRDTTMHGRGDTVDCAPALEMLHLDVPEVFDAIGLSGTQAPTASLAGGRRANSALRRIW